MNDECGVFYFGSCYSHFDIIQGKDSDGRPDSSCCNDYRSHVTNGDAAVKKTFNDNFEAACGDKASGKLKEAIWDEIYDKGPRCRTSDGGTALTSSAGRPTHSPFHTVAAAAGLTYLVAAVTVG